MVSIFTPKPMRGFRLYSTLSLHQCDIHLILPFFHPLTPTIKFSKGETLQKRRETVCNSVLLFPTIKSSCFVLVSPPSRLNTHTLISALKFMKIISVIFSQCLPACYIYLYITTLLNQFKVGRSHDYIEAGKGGGEDEKRQKGEREEKSMPLGNCILQRYFVH